MGATVDYGSIRPEEWAEARRYALVIEWSEENDAYLASATRAAPSPVAP